MTRDLQEQLQDSLGEAYRIERELGGGGMSRVFLALETSLQRHVVVKVLLPELAAGVSVERFRREIHLAAQLQHPHIVPLLSAGESAGLPYFTMPYVDGESLRARLLRERELPVPAAARVLRDVAAALAYAHARGVVHRDIKPDNVLLSHGVAVVTDFGVAKALTVSAGGGTRVGGVGLTSLGVTLGTPTYMAPEQGAADPGMDHRVDLYAFGVMAYEMLTGEPPFTGPSPHAVLGAHLAGLPQPIGSRRPAIPPVLAHLVMQCLEKRPADRPQSADEIIGTLDMLSTPSGTLPITVAHRATTMRRPGIGSAARWMLVAAAVALVIVVTFLAWPRGDRAPGDPETPPAPAIVPPPAPPSTATAAPPPAPPPEDPVVPAEERPTAELPRPAPRARTTTPAAPPDESPLLARLKDEAAAARARALAAGVNDSILRRGDSGLAVAESLTEDRRTAEAAAALSNAAALWSAAADRAAADRVAAAPPSAAPGGAQPPAAPAPTAESVPPPARPPVPAPVPARPAPRPDPARQIDALFAEYAAAIEARDVEAIRRTYPGLSSAQAREWEEFFRRVPEVEVDLDVADLAVTGDAAEARLEGVYVFQNPGTRRTQREPVTFQATLRRDGDRWRIVSLR